MASTLLTMFSVRIPMRTYDERVECEFIAPGVAQLTEFNQILPLAPGDVVSIDEDGVVQDLIEQAPGSLVEVFFRTPVQQARVEAVAAEWGSAVRVVTHDIPYVLMLTQNMQWVRDVVAGHPMVDNLHEWRTDEPIDLPRLMREALEDS